MRRRPFGAKVSMLLQLEWRTDVLCRQQIVRMPVLLRLARCHMRLVPGAVRSVSAVQPVLARIHGAVSAVLEGVHRGQLLLQPFCNRVWLLGDRMHMLGVLHKLDGKSLRDLPTPVQC